MAPLRVLHVVEAAFAGVGRHVNDLVETLDSDDIVHQVVYGPRRASDVFVDRSAALHSGPSTILDAPLAIDMTRGPSVTQAKAVRQLTGVIRGLDIDVVHGHSTGGGLASRLAGRLAGIPAVFTPNAFLTLRPDIAPVTAALYRGVERSLRPLTDALICVSIEERTHADAERFTPTFATVIENGIEPVGPTLADADPAVLAQFQSEPAMKTIGFVGRLDDQKRPQLLLEGFAALVHGLGESKVQLVMVGSGDLAPALRQQTHQLGISDAVIWLGEQDGPSLMPHFDAVCVPSSYEGFPYVVLEALRAGTPVVTARQVPIKAFLAQGCAAGLTAVEAEDAPALARGLADTLAKLDAPHEIATTQSPFTTERMATATAAVYETVARH